MVALAELDFGMYEIGAMMSRSPHTIRKYVNNPIFTDPKFQELVEEYKQKELIDLTVLNIESRARLHDLVPTMTPIEAIALMDKSFGQRRLLEGKSTENIFSLRAIITEAHKEPEHAADQKQKQSSPTAEHPHGDSSGQAAPASGGNRLLSATESRGGEEEEAEIVP